MRIGIFEIKSENGEVSQGNDQAEIKRKIMILVTPEEEEKHEEPLMNYQLAQDLISLKIPFSNHKINHLESDELRELIDLI